MFAWGGQTIGMAATLTRIDPAYPICWEDPTTLRIGFERAIARITSPSAGVQRFIGALRTGVDAARLPHEARRVGAPLADVQAALTKLGPALLRVPVPEHGAKQVIEVRAAVCDGGRQIPALQAGLESSGACVFTADASHEASGDLDLVVFVERFWEPLERSQRWLMAGVPQLLIRFTDGAVHVGPIVAPEGAPCHTCVSLDRIERDAATAALAAQLAGSQPSSEHPESALLAAAYAAKFIHHWRAGERLVHHTRVVLPVARGIGTALPRRETVVPHTECACGAHAELHRASVPRSDHPGLADEA